MKRYLALTFTACCLSIGIGCGEKEPEATVPAGGTDSEMGSLSASTLPGANDVIAALDEGNYRKAVATLAKLGRGAKQGDPKIQFMILSREVKERLLADSATSPEAGEALKAVRLMSVGR